MTDATRDRPVRSGDVDIHLIDRGPEGGDAVVLLHGWPDSSALWRHQIPGLVEAGFRVLAPDQRGFGRSGAPEETSAYSLSTIIGDLMSVVTDSGVERFHLVGHDWGAAVAWTVARHLPERLLSLTVLSVGHPDAFRRTGLDQRARSWYILLFQAEGVAEEWLQRDDWAALRAFSEGHPEAERWIRDLSRPHRLTASLEWYRRTMTPDVLVAPPQDEPPVAVDTMGIWSTGDVALLEDQMTGSERYVDGTWRYERVEASHWIPLDVPDTLTGLLVDWLSAHRR